MIAAFAPVLTPQWSRAFSLLALWGGDLERTPCAVLCVCAFAYTVV